MTQGPMMAISVPAANTGGDKASAPSSKKSGDDFARILDDAGKPDDNKAAARTQQAAARTYGQSSGSGRSAANNNASRQTPDGAGQTANGPGVTATKAGAATGVGGTGGQRSVAGSAKPSASASDSSDTAADQSSDLLLASLLLQMAGQVSLPAQLNPAEPVPVASTSGESGATQNASGQADALALLGGELSTWLKANVAAGDAPQTPEQVSQAFGAVVEALEQASPAAGEELVSAAGKDSLLEIARQAGLKIAVPDAATGAVPGTAAAPGTSAATTPQNSTPVAATPVQAQAALTIELSASALQGGFGVETAMTSAGAVFAAASAPATAQSSMAASVALQDPLAVGASGAQQRAGKGGRVDAHAKRFAASVQSVKTQAGAKADSKTAQEVAGATEKAVDQGGEEQLGAARSKGMDRQTLPPSDAALEETGALQDVAAKTAELYRADGTAAPTESTKEISALPPVVRSTLEAIPNPYKTATIEIQPEGFGKIQIRMASRTTDAGQVWQVDIRTSDPAAHALLSTHIDELRQNLKTDLVSVAAGPGAPDSRPASTQTQQNADQETGQREGRRAYREQGSPQQQQRRRSNEQFVLGEDQ